MAYSVTAHGVCCVQDLSKEQSDSHKVLVQPALEVAANATVMVLQQLIKSITEQVTKSHCILLKRLPAGLHKYVLAAVHCTIATPSAFAVIQTKCPCMCTAQRSF